MRCAEVVVQRSADKDRIEKKEITKIQKSPGRSRGFLSDIVGRSVTETTDSRSTPVEAINQRSSDGLNKRMEGHRVTSQRIGSINQLVDGLLVIVSRTIFSLHEPAGSAEAEDVEVVFDTA